MSYRPGEVFLPIDSLPVTGGWRFGQWNVATRTIDEAHGAWYYPTIQNYNAPGRFNADAHTGALGDFNGDGLQDIALSWVVFPHTIERTARVEMSVILNQGGSLKEVPLAQMPDTMLRHMAYHVVVGRFNSDGLDDLALGSMGVRTRDPVTGNEIQRSEPAVLAYSLAGGGFADGSADLAGQTLTQPAAGTSFMHDTSAGDLNGDGIDDLFAGGKLWLSKSGGGWADATASVAQLLPNNSGVVTSAYASAIGDLNGDGRADILALYTNFTDARVVLLSSGGANPTFTRVNLPAGLYGTNTKDDYAVIVDVNRDGLNDIVVRETRANPYYSGAALQILVQTAPGVFQDQTAQRIDNSTRQTTAGEGGVFALDANGDGHTDLIQTNGGTNIGGDGLAIFLNDGAGNFKQMDLSAFPFIQRNQLKGWEDVPAARATRDTDRAYPIHIDQDGLIDFVVQIQEPLTAWPQTQPSTHSLYTILSSAAVFNRDAAETLNGSRLADRILGFGGDDVISGLGGDDSIDGGAGKDTAVYSGARADYTVMVQADGQVRVTSKSTGGDGTDTLVGVERLRFTDGLMAVDVQGNGGQAYRLYQAAFNRTPDQGGLGYQMNAMDGGLGLAQVAANFIASPEFQSTYGTLNDTQFVTQLYQNVLHRAPDSGGLAFHVNNLATGANTRANVLVGFSESPENQAALIGTIQNGMVYTI